MPWFHTQWGTYGSWLPGDPRGFRSRGHRVNSSGTYKDPPPAGEHAGLHRHAELIMREPPVVLSPDQRRRVVEALVEKVCREGMNVLCVSVSRAHVHCLGEFEFARVKLETGKLKRHSSLRIRDELPGTVWSAGCHPEWVKDAEHLQRAYLYVLEHVQEGAAVHSFREPQ